MRSFIILTLLISITYCTSAQKIKYGIKGGVNFSKLTAAYQDEHTVTSDAAILPNAGVFADVKFNNISLQPALLLTGKGAKYDFSKSTVESAPDHTQISFYFLQVPINVLYHLPVKTNELFFGGGPYYAYCISTKSTLLTGETRSSYIQIPSETKRFKKTDYGIGIIAGFKFANHIFLNANYDFGISDLGVNNDKGSLKTRTLSIAAGYQF